MFVADKPDHYETLLVVGLGLYLYRIRVFPDCLGSDKVDAVLLSITHKLLASSYSKVRMSKNYTFFVCVDKLESCSYPLCSTQKASA